MKQMKKRQTKNDKSNGYKTFQDEMFSSGAKNNIITSLIILVYILIFSGATFKEMAYMVLFATISVLIFQFFVAPFTNASYTRNISNLLISWKEGSLDAEKTTTLLIEVLRCPRIIMYFIFVLFGLASLLFIVLTYFFLGISLMKLVFLFIVCAFASYVTGIIALYTSELVCNKYAIDLFDSEINIELLKEKKYYGVSLKVQFVLFTIIPVFFISALVFVFFLMQNTVLQELNFIQIGKTIAFFICNSILLIGLFLLFRNNSILEIGNVQNILEWLSVTDFKFEKKIPIALTNEISYISFLLKNTINRFPPILNFHSLMSLEITERVLLLKSFKSEQVTLTETNLSIIQEIKDKMSQFKLLTENVYIEIDKIFDMHFNFAKIFQDIHSLTMQTKENANSFSIENIEANRFIKTLNSQLSSISEVTRLLTDIADQIKIIAFNAELEAIKAGSEGQNFIIIAGEIRRLADYTMDSIIETKDQISLVHETAKKFFDHMQKTFELNKQQKNLLVKNEILLDSIQVQMENETLDSSRIETIRTKQEEGREKIASLLEQLLLVFNEYSLYSYDMDKHIEYFTRIADTLAKGEV